MKIFECQSCEHLVYFENTSCDRCGHRLGYLPDHDELTALEPDGDHWRALSHPETPYRDCANYAQGACNWMVPRDAEEPLCAACRLNRTIPNLGNPTLRGYWQSLETAKHRLIYSLLRLKLPVVSKRDEEATGLAFDFVSSDGWVAPGTNVTTGHAMGLVTINVSEADPAERERMRVSMGERYRTLLGHFRHEVGHYYCERLVEVDEAKVADFRAMFSDEREDYQAALNRYYASGAPAGWQNTHVSNYATAHPWEDWAETWAHYLHMVDTLETSGAFGLHLTPGETTKGKLRMKVDFDPYTHDDFSALVNAWIPLTHALNSLNRSMGQPDFYPFVLPAAVQEKLAFVHRIVRAGTSPSD